MSDVGNLSLAELTAWVQAALRQAGISTVLSGGSCVTIWSDNAYVSDDIDLVADGIIKRQDLRRVMRQLGFAEHNRYFTHAETSWWVEFPPGPLGVGEERPKEIVELPTNTGSLRILSPTDCIKDRLTWWFHNADRQCLDQAVRVALRHDIHSNEIRRWAKGEGALQRLREFEEVVRKQRLLLHARQDQHPPDRA